MADEVIKILAIDDQADNLTTLKAVLADAFPGARVLTAASGAKGLELALTEDPDVILLDIIMPGMDGFSVCRKLKEHDRLRLIPVVFLTALQTDRENRIKALDVGAEAFLSKPIDEVELTAQVRAMAKIKAANQLRWREKEELASLVAERTRALEQELVERRKAEQELEGANESLRQSQAAILTMFEELGRETTKREESEYFFKEAQRAAFIGSYKYDLVTGFWESSEVLDQIFGIDQHYGRTLQGWIDLVHPDDRGMMEHHLREDVVSRRQPFDKEYRIVRKADGQIRWVHGLGNIGSDAGGKMTSLLGTIQDITQRKQAENYRQLSTKVLTSFSSSGEFKDALQQILAAVKQAMGCDAAGIRLQSGDDFPYLAEAGFSADFLLTENTLVARDREGGVCRGPDGKTCLECTCGLVLSGGTDPANVLFTPGGSWWMNDSLPLFDLPAAEDPRRRPRNRCIHDGYRSVALIPIRDKTKIVGLLHLNGRKRDCFTLAAIEALEGLAGIIGEALMRDQAEAALRESEQRFRSLYDSMSEGVALHELFYDPAGKAIDYRVLAVNPAYETITGLMADQVLGREATVAYGTGEAPYLDRYARVVASGKPAQFETRFDALGKDFRISAFSPAKDQFATVFEDISERKRAESVLAAAKTVAEEANQSKDRLLATVSHELRTPLTPLLMRLSMLEEDSEVPASLRESMTMMRQSVEMESRLIDGLLDLTRMTRGTLHMKPEVVDAHELLERALGMSVEDSDAIAPVIRCELKASQHMVRVDPMRLQQVCWNVIKNAVQYTPAGGTLTIESRNTANGMLELQFIDTGIGIAPEFLPRVFDAFERGPNMGHVRPSGLGLGMAIAKSLMEHLGGSIDVSSEGPGKGSTFTVRLPLAEAAEEKSPVVPATVTPDSVARRLRILLVEDDAATLEIIAEVLRAIGHDVNTAATVKEAIAAAESAAFDLLVSDIGMPDGSGLDVMRWFSKYRPIPGIAVSGYGTEEDMQRSLEAGFFTHIIKPVPVSTLRWAIQEATAPVQATGA